MKKKRFLFSLLMAIVMMAMSPQKVWADCTKHTTTGTCSVCGKNIAYQGDDANAAGTANAIHWEIVKNGETDTYTLEISGTGATKDYTSGDASNEYTPTMPWLISVEVRDKVTAISIAQGITRIGNLAFSNYRGVASVSIPEGVESIGDNAFGSAGFINGINDILLPASLKTIGASAFSWTNVKTLRFAANSQLTTVSSNSLASRYIHSITFTGAKPEIANDAFSNNCANVIYPASWGTMSDTSDKYGATYITWLKDGQLSETPATLTLGADAVNAEIPAQTSKFYTFTPSQSGLYSINVGISTGVNAGVYTYEETLTTFFSDEGSVNSFSQTLQLETGKTYYFKVYSYQDNTVSISITAPVTSGTFGTDNKLTWSYDNGTLTIGGTGALDCKLGGLGNVAPYGGLKDLVTKLVVGKGITSLGESAFLDASKLNTVEFEEESTCTTLGTGVFDNTPMTTLTLPASCTSMKYAFARTNIQKLYVSMPDFADDSDYHTEGGGPEPEFWQGFENCNNAMDVYFLHQAPYEKVKDHAYQDQNVATIKTTLHAPVTVTAKAGEADAMELASAYADASIPSYTFTAADLHAKNINPCAYTWKNGETAVAYGTAFNNLTQNVNLVGSAGNNHTYGVDFTCTVCGAAVPNNMIIYTASAKLAEATETWNPGLHTNAFDEVTITSHTFENGVGTITFSGELTSIGDNAFYQCSAITGITIPSSVTSIGNFAFSNCYMTSSNLHNSSTIDLTQKGLTIIDTEQADGLLIKDNCAVKCRPGATSVTIPSSVTSIGEYAFSNCSNLASITFTTPSSVTSIGQSAFSGCTNLATITIPGSVASIGNYAFNGCSNLTSVNFSTPCSLTTIASQTFGSCTNLTSITIPNSVTSIATSAFSGCTNLATITIPGSVTSIGNYAFDNTAWYNAQPNGMVYAGCVAYKYKGTMPENTAIELKADTKGIASAFAGCSNLTSITIPEGVTNISSGAFRDCKGLTSITIPGSMVTIGIDAFYGCSGLTSVNISTPSSLTKIGDTAFRACMGITSITIPSSVTSIGNSAFWECGSLKSVICESTTPASLSSDAFKYYNDGYQILSNLQAIYVPASSVDTYKAASGWSDYASKITAIPDAITLNDETDPTSMLAIWATANVTQNLTLTGRTLYKDGYYNTLCLPFSLTAEQLAADNCPLKGCTLKEVTGASIAPDPSDNTKNIMTITLDKATALEAGKPYLIKWEAESQNIVNPTFTGVTITKSEPSTITGDNLDVVGIFAPKTMATSDTDLFFLGAENKFYTSNAESGANLKGYRCYFKQKSSNPAKALNFVLDEDVTTSVTSISPLGELEGAPVYNLQGVRVGSGYKGIVIKNGRKYINK